MNKIFYISAGESSFHDNGHMKNFIKYLFSESSQHKSNEKTKFNIYQFNGKIGMIDDNKKNMQTFNRSVKINSKKAAEYKNDLCYIGFLFIINNKLLTNLFKFKNKEFEWMVDEAIIDHVIDNYFNSNKEKFFEFVENVLEKVDDVYWYYDIPDSSKLKIDKRIQDNWQKEKPEDVLISISHHDQEFYHIHRIIKK